MTERFNKLAAVAYCYFYLTLLHFFFLSNSLCIFELEQEVVGRWAAQQEKELKLLARTDGSRLFSNLTRGNHYLVQAEGYLNNSGSGQTSEMALIWNRTLPGGSVSTGMVQPVLLYKSCVRSES